MARHVGQEEKKKFVAKRYFGRSLLDMAATKLWWSWIRDQSPQRCAPSSVGAWVTAVTPDVANHYRRVASCTSRIGHRRVDSLVEAYDHVQMNRQ